MLDPEAVRRNVAQVDLLRMVRRRARLHRLVRRHLEARGHREHRRLLHQRIDLGVVVTGPGKGDTLGQPRFGPTGDCVGGGGPDGAFLACSEHVRNVVLVRSLRLLTSFDAFGTCRLQTLYNYYFQKCGGAFRTVQSKKQFNVTSSKLTNILQTFSQN